MSDTQQRIDQLVKSNNILLFMKGSASFPCAVSRAAPSRFSRPAAWRPRTSPPSTCSRTRKSARASGLQQLAHDPQLYVQGEFIGGSDIMMEMYESGELQQLLAPKA